MAQSQIILVYLLCGILSFTSGQSKDICKDGMTICSGNFNTALKIAGSNETANCSAAFDLTSCLTLLRPLCSSKSQTDLDKSLSQLRNDFEKPPTNCLIDVSGKNFSVSTCNVIFNLCGNSRIDPQNVCSEITAYETCLSDILDSCNSEMNATGLAFIEGLKNSTSLQNCQFDSGTRAPITVSGAECHNLFTNCAGSSLDNCSQISVYEDCASSVAAKSCDLETYRQILDYIGQIDQKCNEETTTDSTITAMTATADKGTTITLTKDLDTVGTSDAETSIKTTAATTKSGTKDDGTTTNTNHAITMTIATQREFLTPAGATGLSTTTATIYTKSITIATDDGTTMASQAKTTTNGNSGGSTTVVRKLIEPITYVYNSASNLYITGILFMGKYITGILFMETFFLLTS